MITVSIVEDDDEIRQSLSMLINATDGFECISTHPDGESAVKKIPNELPDVILMDIGLPGISGIETIKRLKEKITDIDVIVLTIHENDKFVFDALCAGATGYLLKETPPLRIMESIIEVRNGGSPMSTQIARMVVTSFKLNPAPDLTQRETEVLSCLVDGMSYKMIADKLFISEETVRRHIKNIYRKLEVHSKSEAVAKAIREKLV
ncbi:MAG: response regulator transcription factor [Melioribacteraceae bacterium]|nr:response regulator transcription factor [Melioribacteraceae bacterium]MCF8356326.1 response regulator transcription factor [Melioribacteraceae bacterium]MCF8395727.1 response regulator transcription factor [Melioribacteraceae bacterium]MCF8420878.1 response regulator transcription factor [Melioribacteraceae bacterium]